LSVLPLLPTSLIDSTDGCDNELIVVEGVSAANAVKSVRDRRLQAVLPMQGKVPNARRKSLDHLLAHPHIADLLQSIHPLRRVETRLTEFRYERLLILADPDADGLHASILLVLFLQQSLPGLIEQGRLFMVRAPLFGFYHNEQCVALAYSETHAAKVQTELHDRFNTRPDKRRYKGIASLDADLCLSLIAPDSSARRPLSINDCTEMCQMLI